MWACVGGRLREGEMYLAPTRCGLMIYVGVMDRAPTDAA